MEKIELASKLILASPPGELEDVFNDLRVIVNDDELLKSSIAPCFDAYHIQNHTTVGLSNVSHKVILSKYNQLPDNLFFDSISKQTFRYDSLEKTVELSEHVLELDEALEPFREAMQTAVDGLVQSCYPTGHASVHASEQAIAICLVHDMSNRSSYWSGKWLGDWRYDFRDHVLTGFYQVKVHYYENGNVQLRCCRNFSYMIERAEDPAALADEVASHMRAAGNELQASINSGYASLAEGTFKGLRRALPMSKTKIDWDKILAYRMGAAMPLFGLKKQQG